MVPSPKDISAMTAAVPMMMPSTESMARNLCSHRLRRARARVRRPLSVYNIKPSRLRYTRTKRAEPR